jgi:hypothetical protein
LKTLWTAFFLIAATSALFSAPRKELPSLLSVGIGDFDFEKRHAQPLFQIEYKSNAHVKVIRPVVGLMATTKGGVYAYGGFCFDILLSDRWALIPGFAPGIYYHGAGKKLGYPIEFRSSLELAYRFKSEARLSVQIYHMSNASLSHRNPGANSIVLSYGIPIHN